MSTCRIVFLNGSPSAGRTTIARALHRRLAEPFWYFSLDDFRAGYLDAYWRSDRRTLFPRMAEGWVRSLRELARAGNDLIAETIITPDTARYYTDLFGEFTVYFIGIRCPLDVAQEREARRSDRIDRIELDTPEFYAVHAHPGYDLELDSSVVAPDTAAARIGELLSSQPNPSAFGRLAR